MYMHVVLSLANPHNDYIFYILYTVLSFFDFVRLCTQIIRRKIKVFHSVLGFIMFVGCINTYIEINTKLAKIIIMIIIVI